MGGDLQRSDDDSLGHRPTRPPQRDSRAEHPQLSNGTRQAAEGGERMNPIRKAIHELGALPPDPRDFPRSCHPRLSKQNRRGGVWPPPPRPAPAGAPPVPPPRALSLPPRRTFLGGASRSWQ